MLTVLRDFATPTRRFAAGATLPEAEIPDAERAALIAAGYLAAATPEPAAPAPLPAVAAADPVAD